MPRDYGIMGITMMLIGYFNLFTDFGFSEAIIQKKIHDKQIINSIFSVNLAVSMLLALIFYATSGLVAHFFNTPECEKVIKVSSLFFILTSFSSIAQALLRRDMDFKSLSFFGVTQGLLMSTITLLLAWMQFGYWALAYGQLIPILIMTFLLCIKVRWVPRLQYNHRLMSEIYNFGIWNFLKTQSGFVIEHIDKMIIGKYLGPVSLGFYDKSKSIAVMPSESIVANINSVLFSSFSKNKGSQSALQDHFKKSLSIISLIGFPIYIGLFVVTPYLVHGLLGEKWAPMILPFQIILISFLIRLFGGILASLNVGVGQYKKHTLRLLFAGVIFTFSCFLSVKFGLNGIAMSFFLYNFLMIILTMQLSIAYLGMSWMDVIYLLTPALKASLVMFVITKALSYYFVEKNIINLFVISSTGALVYFICLMIDKNQAVKNLRKTLASDFRNIFA